MRDIYLHGALGARFGKHFQFEVETVAEVIQALRANFIHFANAIRAGHYRVIAGKDAKSGIALSIDEAMGFKLGNRAVHIVPATAGRKRGGLGKVIAGIALIGLSAASGGVLAAPILGSSMTGGQIAAALGMSMTLTGVASLLAPEQESGDTTKSFTISGPNSNIREGAILPVAYGQVITGGYLISGGVAINGPSNDREAAQALYSGNPSDVAGGSANGLTRAT